ncbi:HAD family hydrolase [Allokutzneria sp. A3M-2-11 16]|uniref:HAD family hydrolase n=1 Tax=Allokutzneria sp. A3M-2-11 16 TaxID=2962043 RepID=UPI0020B66C1B|nr:HAD family hydrolase [Allokutzneria sp. A3M-2-11 16]MCP3805599.1 HAD family hydrolase [Allokutzneria sp. A3M-2-11 16]
MLFDLDGTLVDTPGAAVPLIRRVVARSGRPMPPAHHIRACADRPLGPTFARLLGLPPGHGMVRLSVNRFQALFRERVLPAAAELVFPGLPELLGGLRASGHSLAVITGRTRTGAEELLAAAGLLAEFDLVVGDWMTPRGKPAADPALLASRSLAVPPENCVVIGDSVDDVLMASAAGMRAVGVTFGVDRADQLVAAGAGWLAGSAAELHGLLRPGVRRG